MKNIAFLLLSIILFASCVNNTSNQQEEAVTEVTTAPTEEEPISNKTFILTNIVDSIITANPNYLDNDIKKKKVADEIQYTVLTAIKDNHDVLTEIPLAYKMMMQKGNKYIVKFELSSYDTRISDKFDIYFNVFTEMSEDEAINLVNNQKYHLSFESVSDVSNKLALPSGDYFYDNPTVYEFSSKTSVHPGSFLLKGVKYTK